MTGDQKYYPDPKLFAEAITMGQQQRIDEDKDAAYARGYNDAVEACAKVAEEYWPKSDDPTDEPGSTIRTDASLSIAGAIRALGKKG